MFVNNIIISYLEFSFIVDAGKGSICGVGDMGMYRDGALLPVLKKRFVETLA